MENNEFAECYFCKEKDSTRLLMSTRLVNDRVETIDICFRCFWREEFEAEAGGEDGDTILSEEGIDEVRTVSSITPLGLRE